MSLTVVASRFLLHKLRSLHAESNSSFRSLNFASVSSDFLLYCIMSNSMSFFFSFNCSIYSSTESNVQIDYHQFT